MAPIFVPKGGLVSWNLWALHRRKDYFGEDAEVFRPERWLDEDEGEGKKKGKKGLRPGWEYLRKFFFSFFFLLGITHLSPSPFLIPHPPIPKKVALTNSLPLSTITNPKTQPSTAEPGSV